MAKRKIKKPQPISQVQLIKGTRQIEILKPEKTFVDRKRKKKVDATGRKAKYKRSDDE